MTEQYVQTLIQVYNTVCTIPVRGEHVAPMVNVMANLQNLIRIMGNELRDQKTKHIEEDKHA